MTRDELLKQYNEGKRDFSHANFRGAALRGVNLSFANFSGSDLSKSNLSKTGLFHADLSKANLSLINLSRSDLYHTNFSGSDLSYADLSNADLLGANFRGAKYEDVVIKHVRVFTSLYKYQVWAIIAEDDSEWIRMGCFFRKREEWENDFWNNDREFKNDNSEDSNMRLAAFNFACKWIDERKNAMEKTN